jgi:HK97 family phage major capsid protein
MKLEEMRQKRGELIEGMQNILNKAESENRDLTAEEKSTYDSMETDQDSLADRIARADKLSGLSNQISRTTDIPVAITPDNGTAGRAFGTKEYSEAFFARMRVGGAADNRILNALQVGNDSEGGYIVPEEFETMLVEAIQDINDFRGMVDVVATSGDRNIPIESTLGVATWTAEEAPYGESDAAFARVILGAHKLGTIVKVSEELLQDSFFDLPGYLARNFGKRFGLAEEAAIVNGDGSGKPTGMVQGASAGITAAGAAAITSDELIDLYHSLKRPYRNNAAWIMNDSTIKIIRKLKDNDAQYLWQQGLQAGEPDRIFGRPVIASDAMPAATTGNVSVLFGDASYYTLADRSGRVMQRLNELYAANGQVGFRMFERLDGKLTLAEAVKKLTQA